MIYYYFERIGEFRHSESDPLAPPPPRRVALAPVAHAESDAALGCSPLPPVFPTTRWRVANLAC